MILVVGLGAMALFGLLDFKQSMWLDSLPLQNDFTRLILHLEQDQLNSDRIIAFEGAMPLESGTAWSSNTHDAQHPFLSLPGIDLWDLYVGIPVDMATFKSCWASGNPNYSTYSGSSTQTASAGNTSEDSAYAMVFLKGANTIHSVLYITYAESAGNLTYTMHRYANNGNRLVSEDYISFTVEGFQMPTSVAQNDQQNEDDVSLRWVKIFQSGSDPSGARVGVRFPVAFNRGIRDMKNGDTAATVKQLNDWIFYFSPEGANRWIVPIP